MTSIVPLLWPSYPTSRALVGSEGAAGHDRASTFAMSLGPGVDGASVGADDQSASVEPDAFGASREPDNLSESRESDADANR